MVDGFLTVIVAWPHHLGDWADNSVQMHRQKDLGGHATRSAGLPLNC